MQKNMPQFIFKNSLQCSFPTPFMNEVDLISASGVLKTLGWAQGHWGTKYAKPLSRKQ